MSYLLHFALAHNLRGPSSSCRDLALTYAVLEGLLAYRSSL